MFADRIFGNCGNVEYYVIKKIVAVDKSVNWAIKMKNIMWAELIIIFVYIFKLENIKIEIQIFVFVIPKGRVFCIFVNV